MPKSKSNTKSKTKSTAKSKKTQKSQKKTHRTFRQAFYETREKIWDKKRARLKLHHSFKRSYREDYVRGLQAPGLVAHAMSTLKIIFKNWKLFFGLIFVMVFLNIFFVGLMSEDTYQTVQDSLDQSVETLQFGELGRVAKSGMLLISTITTGGLSNSMTEVQQVFLFFFTAMTILVAVYILRHLLAGNRPRLRDGLYNALAPLVPTMLVLLLIFVHLIPIFIFTILYSTAVSTDFLSMPLYAFLFWLLSVLLILLSAYLLPVSLLSLCAVTVPGIYPMHAINAVTDLIQGRRTKFIIRIMFGLVFLGVIVVLFMLPLIWLDLVLKQNIEWLNSVPIVPFLLQFIAAFSVVYMSAYIYLFYRRMLDDPE